MLTHYVCVGVVLSCGVLLVSGVYCTNGQALSCPAKTYQPYTGQSSIASCLDCPVGAYCPASGASEFVLAPPGTYQDEWRQAVPKQCETGTYNPLTGSKSVTACIPCPAQSPNSPRGSTSFQQCGLPLCEGGKTTVAGGVPCQADCDIGHYCALGATIPCPAGSYSDVKGQRTKNSQHMAIHTRLIRPSGT
jgi:hypothetical protein